MRTTITTLTALTILAATPAIAGPYAKPDLFTVSAGVVVPEGETVASALVPVQCNGAAFMVTNLHATSYHYVDGYWSAQVGLTESVVNYARTLEGGSPNSYLPPRPSRPGRKRRSRLRTASRDTPSPFAWMSRRHSTATSTRSTSPATARRPFPTAGTTSSPPRELRDRRTVPPPNDEWR